MLLSNPYEPDPRVYREANSLVLHGHSVTVYAWDRQGEYPARVEQDGVKIERIHVPAGYGRGTKSLAAFLRFGLAAARRLLSASFDVLHCHDLDTMPFGYAIARVKNKPVIFDAHEPYSLYTHLPNLLGRMIALLERWMTRRADHLITVTPATVRWFTSLGAHKVTLVANYPDEIFLLSDGPTRRPADDPVVLGWIGALKPVNRLELIVEAACQFNTRHPDTPLQVLFVGPVLPGYKKILLERALPLGDQLSLVGAVPFQEVPNYYRQIDVSIMVDSDTPQKRMALNLKLFESMAMGVPIIVQPTGDAPKLVNRERCGLVLTDCQVDTIVEALEALSADPDLRHRLGCNGRQAVRERYNWGVSEKALLDVYNELFGNSGRQSAGSVPARRRGERSGSTTREVT
jgi:glycosyltransferase involved in cell wall biosynthesis